MEVEVKVQVSEDRLAGLRTRLASRGASARTERQEDTFFEHPARNLAASDEAFRLRRTEAWELTYKGPRRPGDVKARAEHNVGVQVDPTPMLQALGFRPAVRLVKTREAWRLPEAEVALDHVEGLGWFVEIEAATAEDPHGVVERVRTELGLGAVAPVVESYVELALAAGVDAAQRL